jgi:hypothetical protein
MTDLKKIDAITQALQAAEMRQCCTNHNHYAWQLARELSLVDVLPAPQGERRERVAKLLIDKIGRSVPDDCGECHYSEIDEKLGDWCSYDGGGICKDMTQCICDWGFCLNLADTILQLIQPVPEIPLLTDRQIDDIRMAVFPQLEKTFKRKWSDVCGDIDTEQFLIEITNQTGMKVAEAQRDLCLAALKAQGGE